MRLDKYLTDKGIYKSRTRAERAIYEKCVKVDGIVIEKPSFDVPEGAFVEALPDPLQYVSRGALKLEFALDYYNLDVNGMTCLDIGASTGGFTEVMLLHGAEKVYAVDVGSSQLDPKISGDVRVVNMEKTDVRDISESFFGTIDFVSCDCSFISLKMVLGTAYKLLKTGGTGVFLVKPQFEVGGNRKILGKNGVVKDEKVRQKVLSEILSFAVNLGFKPSADKSEKIPKSPILGGDGNVEYLLKLVK